MSGADEIDQKALDAGYVCVGALRGAHGVKGLVKIDSFTVDPDTLFNFDDMVLGAGFTATKLTKSGKAGTFYLARVAGISNREEAQAAKGKRLFVQRDLLELTDDDQDEDDFFHADLIGLEATDLRGGRVGHVRSVEDFGAGDLLEIALDQPVKGLGRTVYVPFTRTLVPSVDIANRQLTFDIETWMQDQTVAKPDGTGDAGGGTDSGDLEQGR